MILSFLLFLLLPPFHMHSCSLGVFHLRSIPKDTWHAESAHLGVVHVWDICSLPGVSWQVELLLQRQVRRHCYLYTLRSVISLPQQQWLWCSVTACLLRPRVQIIVYFQGDVGRAFPVLWKLLLLQFWFFQIGMTVYMKRINKYAFVLRNMVFFENTTS